MAKYSVKLIYSILLVKLILSANEYQLIGEFEIEDISKTVKLYASLADSEEILKSLHTEEKYIRFNQVETFETCPEFSLFSTNSSSVNTVSLFLLDFASEPKLYMCRLENGLKLFRNSTNMNSSSIQNVFDTIENFAGSLIQEESLAIQVFILQVNQFINNLKIKPEICDSGCLECPENPHLSNSCKTCRLGFFQISEKCEKCDKTCKFCNSSSFCEINLKNSISKSNPFRTLQSCSNCKSCSEDFCQECNSGYFLKDSKCEKCENSCSECFSNCQSCNENDCFQCKTEYFLSEGLCMSCDLNCSSCFGDCLSCNSSNCLICEETHTLHEGSCFICSEECGECFDHCLNCTDFECLECSIGFYVFESTCRSCKDLVSNCAECEEFGCFLCDSGFIFNQDSSECVERDSLSLDFMEGYLSIKITFSKIIWKYFVIEDVFEEKPETLFGKNPQLKKINDNEYQLVLGKNYPPDLYRFYIKINCHTLKIKDFYCIDLRVHIQLNHQDFPKPSVEIIGPDEILRNCDGKVQFHASFSKGSVNNILKYEWFNRKTGEIVSENSTIDMKMNELINIFNVIERNVLEISLKVSNIYEKTSTHVKRVKILKKSLISLPSIRDKEYFCDFNKDCQVFISKLFTCIENPYFKFEWSCLNSTSHKILNAQSLPSLIIKKNNYSPSEEPYHFRVKVSNLTGNATYEKTIKVNIKKKKPVINIGRSFGPASNNENLILNGSLSKNPNFYYTSLNYRWEVKIKNSVFRRQSNPVLTISEIQLPKADAVSVNLTVCLENTKDICKTLLGSFQISNQVIPKVQINELSSGMPLERFPKSLPIIFKAEVLIKKIPIQSLNWYLNDNWNSLGSDYFLEITPQNLNSGSYTLKLDVEILNEIHSFFHSFQINKPPDSGSFEVEPEQGVEIETFFLFLASDWKDSEEDYPIFYEFGYFSQKFKLTLINHQDVVFSTFLSRVDEDLTAFVIVCDSLGDCSRKEKKFEIFLSEVNRNELFEELSKKQILFHDIPGFVISLLQSIVLSEDSEPGLVQIVFEDCVKKMNEFINKSFVDELILNQSLQVLDIFKKKPSLYGNCVFLEDSENDHREKCIQNTLKIFEIINLLLDSVKIQELSVKYYEKIFNIIDEVLIIGEFLNYPEGLEILFKAFNLIKKLNILTEKFRKTPENPQFLSENIYFNVSVFQNRNASLNFTFKKKSFSFDIIDYLSELEVEKNFLVNFAFFYPESPEINELAVLSIQDLKKMNHLKPKKGLYDFRVNFLVDFNLDELDYEIECWYAGEDLKWVKDGCEFVKLDDGIVVCECDAFILKDDLIFTYNWNLTIKRTYIEKRIEYKSPKSAFYTVVTFYTIFIILLVYYSTKYEIDANFNDSSQRRSDVELRRLIQENNSLFYLFVHDYTIFNIFLNIRLVKQSSKFARCFKLVLKIMLIIIFISDIIKKLDKMNYSDLKNESFGILIWFFSIQTIFSIVFGEIIGFLIMIIEIYVKVILKFVGLSSVFGLTILTFSLIDNFNSDESFLCSLLIGLCIISEIFFIGFFSRIIELYTYPYYERLLNCCR